MRPGQFDLRACAAVALAFATLWGATPAGAAEPVDLVILPIVVHSAASDGNYVSRGISDMISSRLEQTGRVRIHRIDDPAAATTRLEVALKRGQARKGDYVVFGAFTQFGNGASLDIHCIPLDVRGVAEAAAARRIFIQSGAVGDIIPKLDEIVDRLALYVHAGPGSVAAGQGGAVSGSSGAAAGPGPDAGTLEALGRRLKALEDRVFGGGGSAGGSASAPAGAGTPES